MYPQIAALTLPKTKHYFWIPQLRAYLLVFLILGSIFGAIGLYLSNRFANLANTDFSPPPVVVAAAISQSESWDEYLHAVGTINAVRGIDLTSEESGEITQINFESGGAATTGQLMLVLNDEVEKASRQSQLANLNLAKLLFDRDKQLIIKKSIPQTQFDTSKADLERAIAQLAETEARLRNKRIHAPFTGTLGIRQVDVGDYISPGTVITTLQDLTELEIDFTLPGSVAPMLTPGLEITLHVQAFPGREFNATLQAIDAKVDPNTRNILVRAQVLDGDGLLPGMFAQLRIALNRRQNLVTVPETAITYALQGSTVYVIKARSGGLFSESVPVKTGEVRQGRASILSGLPAGIRVVTAGQNKLYRGVSIVIDETVNL